MVEARVNNDNEDRKDKKMAKHKCFIYHFDHL